jgi:hypothetical protein
VGISCDSFSDPDEVGVTVVNGDGTKSHARG